MKSRAAFVGNKSERRTTLNSKLVVYGLATSLCENLLTIKIIAAMPSMVRLWLYAPRVSIQYLLTCNLLIGLGDTLF